MTSNPDTPPSAPSALRELLGVVLIVAGLIAVLTAAYLVDPRAGLAAAGVTVVAAGVALTYREA